MGYEDKFSVCIFAPEEENTLFTPEKNFNKVP